MLDKARVQRFIEPSFGALKIERVAILAEIYKAAIQTGNVQFSTGYARTAVDDFLDMIDA